jgi:hypothetical protein
MVKKWKIYLKRGFLAIATVLSIFTAGYIIYDLYILGLNNVTHRTMTWLAFTIFFTGTSMLIIADDFYKVKK